MVRTADEAWPDDWRHTQARVAGSDGLMAAATGIALGIALGLAAWTAIAAAVWLAVH
jgi:hypothetical protein